ncbi:MAG: hypothetical protein Q7T81_10590 [Pseudolabrys sp.]|nr:hypothetical protein [Pseudolabrys sp.]
MKKFLLALAISATLCSAASAQLVNENLLVTIPEGYKVGFNAKQPKMIMQEMVPQAETVEAWTEMVTVQVFLGMKGVTPAHYASNMQEIWAKSCPNAKSLPVANGAENGYPFLLWVSSCPRNTTTGKPEITWFKAMQGQDSFYLVQKAFKFEPSKAQIETWTTYLKKVSVCDSRRADRPCPKTN